MARRRKKSRKSRSKRRNPSHRRRRSSGRRRTRSNPVKGRRTHRRRRSRSRRFNPAAAIRGFSPLANLKSFAGVAAPLAVGYFGTNIVHGLLKRFVLDRFLGSQSQGVQSAADIAGRLLVSVPIVTLVGGQVFKGKAALVATGGAANVVVNIGRAVAANVPGIPGFAQEALGDYPGTPGAFQAPGVFGFMKPAAATGTGNFLAPAAGPGAKPVAAAQGGRAFL
jgi:hypothetical protein